MQKTQASLAGLTPHLRDPWRCQRKCTPTERREGRIANSSRGWDIQESFQEEAVPDSGHEKVGFVSLSLGFFIGEMSMMEIFNP